MIVFPNCKINIGLQILQKRNDGFHDLETIFYPIPFYDALEIISTPSSQPVSSLNVTGIQIEGSTFDNICTKAYQLLKKDFPDLPPVKIHLHKAIPAGAGLGGGSADGTFMLKLLNDKFRLGISVEKISEYALQLGSDCPFFIKNIPVLAKGRGEMMTPIDLDLSSYKIALVNPRIHISTAWAFSKIRPSAKESSLENLSTIPVESWNKIAVNDFEKPVFEEYPEIKTVRDQLYAEGALYASMTGTGATVYGIFNKNDLPELNFPVQYFKKLI